MDGDEAAPVTRREFNNALALVWTFIMLALSTTVFTSRSPVPTNAIYFVAAIFMVTNYTIASWRGREVSRKSVIIAVLAAGLALVVGIVAFVAGR